MKPTLPSVRTGARGAVSAFAAAVLCLSFSSALLAQGSAFLRGDANSDRTIDLSDAVRTLQHLFLGAELSCREAADVDASGSLEVTDPIQLLGFLFRAGPPPAQPFPRCGVPERDALGCEVPHCEVVVEEDGPVWLGRADGCVQCVPCSTPPLEELVETFREEGIEVLEHTVGFFPVCHACKVCASGRVYFVLVPREDASTLEERGWGRVPPDDPVLGR